MKLSDLLDLMRSDIALKQHWFLRNEGWFIRNVRVYLEPGTLAVLTYRYGHWARQVRVPVVRELLLLPYVLAKTLVVLGFGIYIPSQMKVGRGFCIHNFSGIFLPRTTIGDNFIVFQNVTLGHLRGQSGRPPRIGNNVFIAAGAKLMGDIRIGDNVSVGANSLVVTDVPDNCTVVGVPARIVSRDTAWIQEKLDGKGNHW
jgi:serine O-acetyltransferase